MSLCRRVLDAICGRPPEREPRVICRTFRTYRVRHSGQRERILAGLGRDFAQGSRTCHPCERSLRPAHRIVRAARSALDTELFWLGGYVLVVAIATGLCVAKECNNFLIFRAAYSHLVAGRDLYAAYPAEHVDLFEYSPTFALLRRFSSPASA